jgi:hypothetical protein
MASMTAFGVLSVLLLLICTVSWASAVTNASVDVVCSTSSPSSCQVVPSVQGARAFANNGQLASAWLSDSYNETGWAHLEIAGFQAAHIHSAAIDTLQAYAAGLAEGYLTGVKVSQHSTNTFASYWGTGLPPQPFVDYIETNLAYMRKQADSLGPSDAFWHQVGLILTQMQGVLDGSNMKLAESKMQKLSFFDIMISNIGEVCSWVCVTFFYCGMRAHHAHPHCRCGNWRHFACRFASRRGHRLPE